MLHGVYLLHGLYIIKNQPPSLVAWLAKYGHLSVKKWGARHGLLPIRHVYQNWQG